MAFEKNWTKNLCFIVQKILYFMSISVKCREYLPHVTDWNIALNLKNVVFEISKKKLRITDKQINDLYRKKDYSENFFNKNTYFLF